MPHGRIGVAEGTGWKTLSGVETCRRDNRVESRPSDKSAKKVESYQPHPSEIVIHARQQDW